MEGNTANLLIWLIVMILFLLTIYVGQSLLFRRAVFQVIKIFQKNHSLCSEGYKTIDELGLQPPNFMQRMLRFKPRDYKPYALRVLIQAGIVRHTSEGRVCLLENKIMAPT